MTVSGRPTGDGQVLLGQLRALERIGVRVAGHRLCSASSATRAHGPAAGIMSQAAACCR
jgi:hypothetical protein